MRPDVAVIGGGTAGLAAATALAETGARVVVLESRAVAGGRSRSWVDPAVGAIEDNGQHLLMGCYDEFLAFVRRTGGIETVRFEDRLDLVFADPGGAKRRFRPATLPRPLDLLAGIVGLRGFPWRAIAGAAGLVADVKRGGPRRGERTVAEWLASHRQGGQARRLLWDPIVLATINAPAEAACASLLAPVVARALLSGTAASRIGFATRGLTALVVDPAAAYLASRAGRLRTGVPVVTLEAESAPERVTAAVTRNGERVEAGAFVLAVPHGPAAHILPAGAAPFDAEAALALGASPIVGVHVWFDRPVQDEPMLGFLDAPFEWSFDRGQVEGKGASGYLALVTSAAARLAALDRPALEALAVAEIRRFLPRARKAAVVRVRAIKERAATPVLTPRAVLARPATRTNLRNLVLAGDWTDTGLPATLEGAAQSGHRAAAALAQR